MNFLFRVGSELIIFKRKQLFRAIHGSEQECLQRFVSWRICPQETRASIFYGTTIVGSQGSCTKQSSVLVLKQTRCYLHCYFGCVATGLRHTWENTTNLWAFHLLICSASWPTVISSTPIHSYTSWIPYALERVQILAVLGVVISHYRCCHHTGALGAISRKLEQFVFLTAKWNSVTKNLWHIIYSLSNFFFLTKWNMYVSRINY